MLITNIIHYVDYLNSMRGDQIMNKKIEKMEEMRMSQEEDYRLIESSLSYDKDMLRDYLERYDMVLCIAREVSQKQVPVKPVYDHRYTEMRCDFCDQCCSRHIDPPCGSV